MDTTWWWVFVFCVLVIGLRYGMIAWRIARSRSGLDEKERAVVRRPAAGVGRDEHIGQALGWGVLTALQLPLPLNLRRSIRYRKHRAAAKKLVDFNPRKQNRAQGVIFSFYELRITRTELIKGYEENAQRIPLQGLTATVVTGQTVQIRIEGPDTKFVYRNAFDAEFNLTRALQFARPPELRSEPPRCTPMTARTAGQRLRADLNSALKRAAGEAGVRVLEFSEAERWLVVAGRGAGQLDRSCGQSSQICGWLAEREQRAVDAGGLNWSVDADRSRE